jgi:fatty acid desaturase
MKLWRKKTTNEISPQLRQRLIEADVRHRMALNDMTLFCIYLGMWCLALLLWLVIPSAISYVFVVFVLLISHLCVLGYFINGRSTNEEIARRDAEGTVSALLGRAEEAGR